MCHFHVKKEKKSCHKNSALLQPPEVVLRCVRMSSIFVGREITTSAVSGKRKKTFRFPTDSGDCDFPRKKK